MTEEVNATSAGSILNSQLLDMKTILLNFLYVLVVVWVVRRYRAWRFKTSPASRDEMLVNRQLPSWVRPVELLSALVFFILTVIGLMFITMLAHYLVHPNAGQLSKTASFFLFVEVILAAPVALLMANLVSWLVPPLRKANELAMAGHPSVSFKTVNRRIFKFLAWAAPIVVICMIIAVADPWL